MCICIHAFLLYIRRVCVKEINAKQIIKKLLFCFKHLHVQLVFTFHQFDGLIQRKVCRASQRTHTTNQMELKRCSRVMLSPCYSLTFTLSPSLYLTHTHNSAANTVGHHALIFRSCMEKKGSKVPPAWWRRIQHNL